MTLSLRKQGIIISPEIRDAVNRIDTIDFLRGLVMIIMALDHVREYFHFDSFLSSPTDLRQTNVALFATRWITHICAPTFILLAGTSVYLMGKKKDRSDVAFFLITRGLWLIVVQFTIVRFAWNFDPLLRYNSFSIISAIGFSMIALSALVYLPLKAILAIGLVLVTGHNLLDGISFAPGTIAEGIWSFFHVPKIFLFGNSFIFTIKYPVLPWIGVIALGYCLGRLFDKDYSSQKRKQYLIGTGSLCLIVFFFLRLSNIYGDPIPWTKQDNVVTTVLSILNLEKYPPSLLYLSATLGISLILLGKMEDWNLNRFSWVTLFGRTAFFYYVLHAYVIHISAAIVALASGYSWQSTIYPGSITDATPELRGSFGFNLGAVYLMWCAIVATLYPFCVRWNKFKTANKNKWWVSYV